MFTEQKQLIFFTIKSENTTRLSVLSELVKGFRNGLAQMSDYETRKTIQTAFRTLGLPQPTAKRERI